MALVEHLQPHVADGQLGVRVSTGGRVLQHALKLLLARTPFLLGQVQVSN